MRKIQPVCCHDDLPRWCSATIDQFLGQQQPIFRDITPIRYEAAVARPEIDPIDVEMAHDRKR